MHLNFISLTFRNILGYGNKDSQIHFQSGVNLIVGKNGKGKSTLTDALCFCLYGKPYRNIPIPRLINNKNKKNLYVKVQFTRDNDEWTIVRTLKPDSIEIYKNNVLEKLESHKSLTQEKIDSILGVNYNLFKQIISLSALYNKPFLNLEAKDKRDTLESIFNLKVFSQMLKNLKKKANITKGDLDIKEKEILILKDSTLSLANQLKELETQDEVRKIAHQTKIQTIETEIANLQSQLESSQAEFVRLSSTMFDVPIFDDSEKMKVVSEIANTKSEIQALEKKLAKVNANDLSDFGISELIRPLVQEENETIAKFNKTKMESVISLSEIKNKKTQIQEKYKSEIALIDNEKKNNTGEKVSSNDTHCQELIQKNSIIHSKIDDNSKKIKKMELVGGVCSHCFQTVDEKHKEKEIQSLEKQILELNDELLDNSKKIIEISNLICANKKTEIDQKRTKIDEQYTIDLKQVEETESNLKQTIDSLTNDLKKSQEDIQKRTAEIFSQKRTEGLHQLSGQEATLKERMLKLDSELSSINKKESAIRLLKEENERVIRLTNEVRNRISVIENSLLLKKTQLQEMSVFTPSSFDNLKKDIETKKAYGKKMNEDIKELREKTKVFDIIKGVLDDEGMKKFFFARLLPKMNQLINNYLDFFELPIRFTFNDLFEESMVDLAGNDYIYNSFSAGQQFRINISIILSFIELNKMLNSFNCNLQFFDEIFDSGVDSDGMELVLEKMKDLCDKTGVSAYIISHKAVDDSMNIDRVIKVEMEKGFSRIIC